MSRFKVGDKVTVVGEEWKGKPISARVLNIAHLGKSGGLGDCDIHRLTGHDFWYREDDLLPIPVKKRYEVVRVVEAESEEEAVRIVAGANAAQDDFIVREVK